MRQGIASLALAQFQKYLPNQTRHCAHRSSNPQFELVPPPFSYLPKQQTSPPLGAAALEPRIPRTHDGLRHAPRTRGLRQVPRTYGSPDKRPKRTTDFDKRSECTTSSDKYLERPPPDKRPKRTSDSGMIRNEPIAVIDSGFFPNILPIKLFRRKFNFDKSKNGKI